MNKYLTDEEIKSELTNMLSVFHTWAVQNDLEYSIFAGTLLGAVRHKGFIPWDDDIDICMDRHTYMRFLKILKNNKNNLTDELFASGYELKNSDMPYVKVMSRKLKCNEQPYYYDKEIQIETNLWIDVFPLDGIPNHFPEIFEKARKKIVNMYYAKRENYYGWHQNLVTKRSILGKIRCLLLQLIPYKMVVRLVIQISSSFDTKKCKYVALNVWGNGLAESFPRDYMDDLILYEFDGVNVYGISKSHELLEMAYGDYMQLPPEEKRVNHNIVVWK